MKQTYFSHGKLLLSGEYLVLDGAKALAIPTQKGQEMIVEMLPGSGNIHWTAKDVNGNIWLNFSFILAEGELIPVTVGNLYPQEDVLVLKKIIENALIINPDFLINQSDYEITTHLQFPSNWGLGSSSTLIANIAKWAEVDAMKLFFNSFEGSGYDVALAMEARAIIYHLKNKKPHWEFINFNPPFAPELFFIHLGQKQNSRNEIANYKTKAKPSSTQIEQISSITNKILECKDLESFEKLITEHETILSKILEIEPIKKRLFNDYPGAIKSLGAWGGDFILAAGKEAKEYFKKKGFETVLNWEEMVKS
ncbi:MAG: GYDIA family GHMP kinase [Bacteroidia bacterium]